MPELGLSESAAVASAQIGWIDWFVVAVYTVGIVALGIWAGYRRKSVEGSGYFLADKALTWPIIGLALFSTNISTIHLVSLAQSGYDTGLAMGNFEWMAAFTLICLSLFFAPFYLRSKVTTLPDFLEKRYCRPCRDWFAAISITAAIVIHLGFSLFMGAVVLEGFLLQDLVDDPQRYRFFTVLTIAGITGLYTIIGGLMAVVLTESVQTIVLLIGSICITVIGYHYVGGWTGLEEAMAGLASQQARDPQTVHRFSQHLAVWRPHGDTSDLPWYSVLLGYPVLGLWYWCADQTIVQRVLGARDENHARMGPLFAGFIKILPVFIFVLPGVICLALVSGFGNGRAPVVESLPINTDGAVDTKQVLAVLIKGLLPVGLKGVMAAALLAALMSTVSGALNSIATLFSYDLYRRWRPDTSDRTLVTVGRIVTFCAMIAAVLWSLQLERIEKIFEGINTLIGYICPPVTALFIWGVFFRRLNARGALITAWFGTMLGAVGFYLDWFGSLKQWQDEYGFRIPFLMIPVYQLIACTVVLFLASHSIRLTRLVAWIGSGLAIAGVAAVNGGALEMLRASSGEYLPATGWILVPGFLIAVCSLILLAVAHLVPPQKDSPEAGALVWRSPLEAIRGAAWRGLANYRLVAAALFFTMVVLYIAFGRGEDYRAVRGAVILADGQPVAGARLDFAADDPQYDFTAATDHEGRYGYAWRRGQTPPDGTRYRITITPLLDTVVVRGTAANGTTTTRVLTVEPAGVTIHVEPLDDGRLQRLVVSPKGTEYKLKRELRCEVVPATPLANELTMSAWEMVLVDGQDDYPLQLSQAAAE